MIVMSGFFTSIKKKAREGWIIDSESELLSPPLITEEKVIIGTKSGIVHSITKDGEKEWSFSAQEKVDATEELFLDIEHENSISATPVKQDNNIYFGTEQGILFCISEKGSLVWKVKTKGPIRTTPVITEKNILVSCGKYICIISTKGEIKKEISLPDIATTKPLSINENILVGLENGNIISFSPNNSVAWDYHTEDKITSSLTTIKNNSKNIILVGSQDNTLYALSEDGESLWTFPTNGAIVGDIIIGKVAEDDEQIIFGSCDNKIYCITTEGDLLWSYETDFWIVAPPQISDINNDGQVEVIAGSYDHKLYILAGEGTYAIDNIPGLGGIINQATFQAATISKEAGDNKGKSLKTIDLNDKIVGCGILNNKNIIVSTHEGKVYNIQVN